MPVVLFIFINKRTNVKKGKLKWQELGSKDYLQLF
jgi:hypothetical protein